MIIPLAQLEVFFFILARIAGVFIAAPLFSSRSFPTTAKVAFAVWLAIVLWYVTPVFPGFPTSVFSFITVLVAEVALGFIIGFVCNLLFIAVQSAGELIDLQMGLSVATALDPIFGSVISVIGRLAFYLALVIFITMDGHHLLLAAFHQSFTVIPAGKIANFSNPNLTVQMMGLGGVLWSTALKLAAPVVLLIFLSDFTFGIVSRVAPQVNVFMLGFQVKPMLGLFGILITLPLLVKYVGTIMEMISEELIKLIAILK